MEKKLDIPHKKSNKTLKFACAQSRPKQLTQREVAFDLLETNSAYEQSSAVFSRFLYFYQENTNNRPIYNNNNDNQNKWKSGST